MMAALWFYMTPQPPKPSMCDTIRGVFGDFAATGSAVGFGDTTNIINGEQGALNLSTSLAEILLGAGAQEYATNQAGEEARHVAGFYHYKRDRWGMAYPIGDVLGDLLDNLIKTPVVYKNMVGMQMLLEGLAMGAFPNLRKHARDSVLRRPLLLFMTGEAFDHKFGKIWTDKTICNLSGVECDRVEGWPAEFLEFLLFHFVKIRQKLMVYEHFGLDWEWVRDAVRETYNDT